MFPSAFTGGRDAAKLGICSVFATRRLFSVACIIRHHLKQHAKYIHVWKWQLFRIRKHADARQPRSDAAYPKWTRFC